MPSHYGNKRKKIGKGNQKQKWSKNDGRAPDTLAKCLQKKSELKLPKGLNILMGALDMFMEQKIITSMIQGIHITVMPFV